jgi:very-short-patch-repair endonuclease
VRIVCPKHGEFWQVPTEHLSGKGCKKCYGNDKMTTEEFIRKSKEIHGDKYDYSKVEYSGNNKSKVCIVCPKHGEFWQRANTHLLGHGCPICKSSKLEMEIKEFLEEKCIKFDYQKRFTWLERKTLDFYLPKYEIAIECQGKQHFGLGGWAEGCKFKEIEKRDKDKKKLCEKNNIVLLYYSNLNIEYPYEVITDKNKLLEIIKSYAKQKLD